MLYIIGLLIIIIKGISFILYNQLVHHITFYNILFIVMLIIVIMLLKKLLKYRSVPKNLDQHILKYRFKNIYQTYFCIITVITYFITIFVLILYFRFNALKKPIDVYKMLQDLHLFYKQNNLLIVLFNVFMLVLCLYVLLLVIKIVKKVLNIHVTKIHFFLMSYKKYISIHTYFRDNLSIDAVFIIPLSSILNEIQVFCCFGYRKNILSQWEEIVDVSNKKLFWNSNDKKKFDAFCEKHSNKFSLITNIITFLLNHLHIILIIVLFFCDIFFNHGVLQYVSISLLPLFFYHIYVSLNQFVKDKITYDIGEIIHTFYYQKVEIVDEKSILINSEFWQMPSDFVPNFIKYESVGFNYTLYVKKYSQ